MALQTQNLTLVGLGSAKDTPPNAEQPPLIDGIHLRWAFKRELGFPWHGFYLFRRTHDAGTLSWLSQHTRNLPPGPFGSNSLDTPLGVPRMPILVWTKPIAAARGRLGDRPMLPT